MFHAIENGFENPRTERLFPQWFEKNSIWSTDCLKRELLLYSNFLGVRGKVICVSTSFTYWNRSRCQKTIHKEISPLKSDWKINPKCGMPCNFCTLLELQLDTKCYSNAFYDDYNMWKKFEEY